MKRIQGAPLQGCSASVVLANAQTPLESHRFFDDGQTPYDFLYYVRVSFKLGALLNCSDKKEQMRKHTAENHTASDLKRQKTLKNYKVFR